MSQILSAIASIGMVYLTAEAEHLERLFAELRDEPGYTVSGPKVSIIVPTHNEEKYIPNLLRSLEKQTYRNFELVVADWSSTDRTREIVRSWGRETGVDVTVVEVDRRGVGYACWLAEQHLSGEIVVRTDADTMWSPYLLETTVRTLLQRPELRLYWVAFTWYDADPITTLFTWVTRHFRDPCRPHGRFMAVRAEVKKVRSIFNPSADVGEDVEVGEWICREFGKNAVLYDRDRAIFTSARRLYAAGVIPYLAGLEFKRGFPPRR